MDLVHGMTGNNQVLRSLVKLIENASPTDSGCNSEPEGLEHQDLCGSLCCQVDRDQAQEPLLRRVHY